MCRREAFSEHKYITENKTCISTVGPKLAFPLQELMMAQFVGYRNGLKIADGKKQSNNPN